jgi:carboxypeptidase C (cathepsin A)
MDFPNMYSGYLDLPGTEKHVFYWYVEATTNPADAPVALWTNGGPGCSGLTGFMTEQGPFHVAEDGSLINNPYAWNNIANMLFIEQPVGVGFSWSGDSSDYKMGDWDAARDNYASILTFLQLHPEVANNDFYITAESYGGHYMPTLAQYIVENDESHTINFKGFAVGNPFTSKLSNQLGEFNTLYGHQLVSKPRFEAWQDDCSGWYLKGKQAELRGEDPFAGGHIKPQACLMDEEIMLSLTEFVLNPYALDYPTCPHVNSNGFVSERPGGRFGGAQRLAFLRHTYGEEPQLLAKIEKSLNGGNVDDEYLPCTDDYATAYLNRLDVQSALHVNGGDALNNETLVDWSECSRSIRYNMSDGRTPMQPIYSYLLNETNNFNLKILVYSGDDDMVCATEGSQEWIYDLGYDVLPARAWLPWFYNDDKYGRQVGGYKVNYDQTGMSGDFAFITAHGCGHEVPTYKPQLALEIFSRYINGSVYV